MNNQKFRFILFLSTVTLIGIAVTQLYWISRTADLQEKEFAYKVAESLKNVAIKILRYNKNPAPLISPVKKVSKDYFVVTVNDVIKPELLEGLLVAEFKEQSIKTDFEYLIYDCEGKKIISSRAVSADGSSRPLKDVKNISSWEYDNYYYGVHFPSNPLLPDYDLWTLATAIMLLVLSVLSYLLYHLYRQQKLFLIQRDFVNNLAHEFNTPLASILLSTEVFNKELADHQTRLKHYAQILKEEGLNLKGKVEKILQMAVEEKSEVLLNKEYTDLDIMLQELKKKYHERVDQLDISIYSSEGVTVYADKMHLRSIFENLIDNAIKHNQKDVRITFTFLRVPKGLQIIMSDDGSGIPYQYRKKIFERFFRIPKGDQQKSQGFGLGLHYVKLLIEAHGGKIELLNIQNKGTTFRIFLPAGKWMIK